MLQAEAAECGLACLAMVAAHYGHRVNVGGLRRKFPVSMKGVTLQSLIEIAGELELAPRALRLEIEELDQLQLPAILHWDLNHFVVLKSVRRNSVTILDPASGSRQITREKLSDHFTGVALELTPTADFKPVDARIKIKMSDLWSRMINLKSAFIQVLSLSILLQVTALTLPFFMQLTVDEAIGQGDTSLLVLLVLGFGVVYLINLLLSSLRAWVVLTLGQTISFQMSGNIVRHMLRLPTRYFESRHVGDLMSRFRSAGPIQELLTQGFVNALIDAFLAITTLIVISIISVELTLVVIATLAVYIVIRLFMYPAVRRLTEEEIIADAKEDTYLMETMRSMRSIKLHLNESLRENGWRNRYAEWIGANYRLSMYEIWANLSESLISSFQYLLIIFIGAAAVISNDMSLGVLLAFLVYRTSFVESVNSLIDQAEDWRLLSVHLERLSDIIAEPKEDIPLGRPRQGLLPGPKITVEDVSFRYSSDLNNVLEDLSFEIPAGSMVSIVGQSGAGKSTLLRIMLGLMQPSSGQCLIDDKPLTSSEISGWRGRISAVMQDDQLLSGSIADNITFFADQPNEENIEKVARMAQIHETITEMPMGYQSLIGDMGNALSAGQRQRIMLARALYRDPDVIFLDEGTANLDEETENLIADMLDRLEITRVAITHRPALVERSDIVLRLVDGKIERIEGRDAHIELVQSG
ncbi:peptidase domain-containing ABC transporter [Parasphingorhabdus sp.]|uniref:peptidase domain-containing ABC transporter n=1 Tax=Parasphingorhabdus sp. TaxID=2709688 RepID=UPI003D2933E9